MRSRWGLVPAGVITGLMLIGLGILACTPLGGWLYSDPTFALSGVRSLYHGAPADTLQVVLTGCNLNDFDVDGLAVEGFLLVGGVPVGQLQDGKPFGMPMRDSVTVTLPLRIPRAETPPIHAKGDDYLATQYELNGNIRLSTPIGVRRVPLRQHGEVRFDSAGVPSGWTVRNARPCSPGRSILPGQPLVPRELVDTIQVRRPRTLPATVPGQRELP